MNDNILGRRIREARGDLSLRDFAQKCNISHTHLDSLEKGVDPRTGKRVKVGLETLKKIAKAAGFSIDYLTGDAKDKKGLNKPSLNARLKNDPDFSKQLYEITEEIDKMSPEEIEVMLELVKRGPEERKAFLQLIKSLERND